MTCRQAPEWIVDTYGYGDDRWGNALVQGATTLIGWARREHYDTYTELTRFVDLDWGDEGAWTWHGTLIGNLLGHISAREWLDHRPILSALVVYADENGRPSTSPGPGFFEYAANRGYPVGRSEQAQVDFWWQSVAECFAHWTHAARTFTPDWFRAPMSI